MGKFSNIWNRSKDGSNREERSFIRYIIISTAIFLLFICVIKRDNLFRWMQSNGIATGRKVGGSPFARRPQR